MSNNQSETIKGLTENKDYKWDAANRTLSVLTKRAKITVKNAWTMSAWPFEPDSAFTVPRASADELERIEFIGSNLDYIHLIMQACAPKS